MGGTPEAQQQAICGGEGGVPSHKSYKAHCLEMMAFINDQTLSALQMVSGSESERRAHVKMAVISPSFYAFSEQRGPTRSIARSRSNSPLSLRCLRSHFLHFGTSWRRDSRGSRRIV